MRVCIRNKYYYLFELITNTLNIVYLVKCYNVNYSMASLKKNVIYSSLLTTANYIFPLLTYPYVSRVLGVDKIGVCNFVDSIINYFVLFSMLGINIMGIREIASCKDNREELNKRFSSLFILNTISTSIVLILLIIAIETVPKLYEHRDIMYIGVLKLIFSYLLIEWLYKGLENFKFITTRTIILKCIYVLAVFLFVKDVDDYKIYYFIMSIMIVINAIINIVYSTKFVSLKLKKNCIKPFLRSFFVLGFYMILTSMYISFNVTYLGFVSGETEVGYYTTATKLHGIILSIFTAFTGVMLPRMSSLVSENNISEFKLMLNKSVNILFSFSIPLVYFCIIFADKIILLISGEGYEGAIIPMQIVIPLILIIGYEQILVIQILMPLKKDKYILINSIIGASIGLLSNILFVGTYKSVGSSLVWLISELSVFISAQYFVWKSVKINFPFIIFFKAIIYNLPLGIILYIIYSFNGISPILMLFYSILVLIFYSLFLQYYIIKNPILINLVTVIFNRLHKD